MTEELREDITHLSIPQFIDFFIRRAGFDGLYDACEILEILRDLSQVSP